MELSEHSLYSVKDFAVALSVHAGSIYQSLPGAKCRAKLGRTVPQPIRFGRSLRWSGKQIIDFVTKLQSAEVTDQVEAPTDDREQVKRGPGRPRKAVAGGAS